MNEGVDHITGRGRISKLTIESIQKMSSMIEEVNQAPVTIANSKYDPLFDIQLEADIDRERISVDVQFI